MHSGAAFVWKAGTFNAGRWAGWRDIIETLRCGWLGN